MFRSILPKDTLGNASPITVLVSYARGTDAKKSNLPYRGTFPQNVLPHVTAFCCNLWRFTNASKRTPPKQKREPIRGGSSSNATRPSFDRSSQQLKKHSPLGPWIEISRYSTIPSCTSSILWYRPSFIRTRSASSCQATGLRCFGHTALPSTAPDRVTCRQVARTTGRGRSRDRYLLLEVVVAGGGVDWCRAQVM